MYGNVIHVVPMRKDVFKAKGKLIYVCNKFGIVIEDLIYIKRPCGHFSPIAQRIGTYFLAGDNIVPIYEKNIRLMLTDRDVPCLNLVIVK